MSAQPTDGANPVWLDQFQPHEADRSTEQIAALLERLAGDSKRILDLGCGDGRVLVPLVETGHAVVGIDADQSAIDRCAGRAATSGRDTQLLVGDFLSDATMNAIASRGPFDVILLLGNTMMTLVDVEETAAAWRAWARWLGPGGSLIIDDIPTDFWPEVAEGNWQSGVSPDGDGQLVWARDDAVFALRTGDQVDQETWELRDDDRRFRLWQMGDLRLLARLSGLSGPQAASDGGLLIFGSD